jgi:hypothetical protein
LLIKRTARKPILFDYRVMGDALWDRFNGGAAGTRWLCLSEIKLARTDAAVRRGLGGKKHALPS